MATTDLPIQFPSITTPGFFHKDPSSYIVEVILQNEYKHTQHNETVTLPPFHWRNITKSRFGALITIVRRTIKLYGWKAVFDTVSRENIRYPSYASLAFHASKCKESDLPLIESTIKYDKILVSTEVETTNKVSFGDLMT